MSDNEIETQILPAEDGEAELAALVVRPRTESLPSILYLHGFGSYQEGEKANFFRSRAQAEGFGFVSLDFQGHGRSQGSIRELTIGRCLHDIERVRRAVPLVRESAAVVGSSLGALAGLWHAAGAPETVRALGLVAPAIGIDVKMAEVLGAQGMADWEAEGALEITNEMGTFELGWEFAVDLETRPAAKLVASHRCPTLIYQGKLDDQVPWAEVAAFAQATADWTRLELLEDGDHRLIDHMDRIGADLMDFVGQRNIGFGGNVE